MKKRLLSTILTVAMVSAMMVGCSSSTTTEDTTTDETTTEESTEESTGESALLTEIKERGYITIATSNDAPFCYFDVDSGELMGLDVEILQAICDILGIEEIQAEVTDFSNMLLELNNGNVDMVADAMYIKDERLEVALFTDVWYTESEAVVIANDTEFTTKESLVDADMGAQVGTAFYETAEGWLEEGKIASLTSFESQATLMTAVNTGKIDAAITDGIVSGYSIAQDSGLELQLMNPYEAEAVGQIGAAVRFEDADFLEEVNAALNELKENGTLMEILESYGLNESYYVGVEEGYTTNVQ